MNEASAWRLALAQHIAPAYIADPKVKAIVVAGSVARGYADRYSDVEIDVFWSEPPSDDERRAAVKRAGGEQLRLWPYEDEEWSENYTVGGVKIELSQFLVETIEGWLADVIDRCDTTIDKHILIAAVQHAVPLHGAALIEQWRAQAAAYPDHLRRAVVSQYLQFDGAWYAREMLAERDDLVFLYDIYCQVEKHILGALAGLNRVYLPHPRGKWMDRLIADLPIAPQGLALRLKQVFRMAPRSGVRLLNELIEETLALVEAHMPDIDTAEARQVARQRRAVSDQPPAALRMEAR